MMHLTIDVASGAPSKTRFQVGVPSAAKVADLRVIIQNAMKDLKEPSEEERTHIATYAPSAKLLYAGRLLEDSQTLAELHIEEGFVLQMFITAAAPGSKRPREAEVKSIPQEPTYNVAELGFDPIRGIPTPGAGNCACGFSAGTSGLCSACYRALPLADKIARCKEQLVLQVERNKKIKENEARAAEEQAKQAAIEAKKRAERAAEIANAEAANMERKEAGKCFMVRPLFGANDCSWNLWGFDSRPPNFCFWSCGVCGENDPATHGNHPKEEWGKIHEAIEKLNSKIGAIVESSDGDYPWEALYFSVAHMKKVGVMEDDSTETALRKALMLPDKTKWTVSALAPTRKTLWDQKYYYEDRIDSAKLNVCKQATNIIRSVCDPKSVISVSFSDDMVVYPNIIAARVKNSPCLLMAYGTRADT